MKLLIATGMFPPDVGGPATYSQTIAEEFSKRGHNITIVTYGDNIISNFPSLDSSRVGRGGQFPISKQVSSSSPRSSESGAGKFQIQSVSRKLPKGIRHLAYFWQVLKQGLHTDIIYAQDAVSAGFPAALAALLLRKPFFLKIVGDHAWEQGQQRFGVVDTLDEFLAKRYGARVGFLRMVEKFTARRAKRIIVPSAYLKSVVERWGISVEHIAIIANAVLLPKTIPAKEEARRALGLDGFLLVTAGRLVPWKGFSMLVELIPKLVEVIPKAKLVIVGDGPERQQLELRIRSASWRNESRDIVLLTGSVSKDKLAVYLAAADIFLLNTGYEGFSHQLIEAMSMGIPVVTTNAGGNKEVVRDGENALVAEYNNLESWKEKILRLYEDQELRRVLSQSNKDITQRYSVENMIQKIENLLLTT
ncbi:MAG: hypothetical protein A3H64_00935 [Candidatus Ryanbacteria bacterium RIFCSPLOWO2_02_FULL_45_11c]|uniref:Glycosyltransferase subfamily 4-like N-terminal domain-containing protein n=1 Tax=Candidatus Ryanbacteria bacterium RIFCSPLOWO2_02_FULL_45_11c TaxID=1802128 RepID=A0A1G2H2E5_9BACT|nr:MAG: hypothetical protein A3H64_00935 [Candidatus Ryanbacteria bacterium RIFCSPLOWO2_02_FULL_45_11c]